MKTRQTDPIMAEVRAIRQAYAARFDYDVDAIFRDVRARQKASGRDYVRLSKRPVVSAGGEERDAPTPDREELAPRARLTPAPPHDGRSG